MIAIAALGLIAFRLTLGPQQRPAPRARGPIQCGQLHERICSGDGFDLDPTGIVLSDRDAELAVQELIQEIVEEHEDASQEALDEELAKRIFVPERIERLERTYLTVLRALERFIDSQSDRSVSIAEKRLLKRRLRKTALELPPPASRYADSPALLAKTDVFYERLSNDRTRLRVGGGYVLGTESRYNLTFTIAHELAHAIDPCELRAKRIAIPAYDRLGACFVHTGLVAARMTRSECGHDDQLAEAFADWLAAQVTTDTLIEHSGGYTSEQLFHSVANSVRDLCEDEDETHTHDDTLHPAPRLRIERIFGDHPQMRQLLHCQEPPAGSVYCDFNWTPATS